MIILRDKNEVPILIDDEDWNAIQWRQWTVEFNWLHRKKCFKPRSAGNIHRALLGDKAGYEIDHKNRNALDNRRCNIHHVRRSENLKNRDSYSHGWVEQTKWGWRARYKQKSANKSLGTFASKEEALEALKVLQ